MATAVPRDPTLSRWQRALLPAVEGSGDGLTRSARDWVVDLVIVLLAVAIGAGTIRTDLSRVSAWLGAADIVLATAACLSLWGRRRHPLAVGVFTAIASSLSGGARGAAIAGVFTVAVHCPPRWTVRTGALAILASAIQPVVYPEGQRYSAGALETGVVLTAVAIGYGLYVRARRELLLSLRERNRRLETEQDLRVRDARHAERTRIAREMHDVLAHRISLLSVHAGALEFNPHASPAEIAQAAGVIRTSARAAQEELREVIGVLRDDGDYDTVPPPQPTLVDVPALVDESRRAGMEVTCALRVDGQLPDRLGRTVYRLVQEALTNVRKHAPGQSTVIAISGRAGNQLTIEVVNVPGSVIGSRRLTATGSVVMARGPAWSDWPSASSWPAGTSPTARAPTEASTSTPPFRGREPARSCRDRR